MMESDTVALSIFIIGLIFSGILAYLGAVLLAQALAGFFRRDK